MGAGVGVGEGEGVAGAGVGVGAGEGVGERVAGAGAAGRFRGRARTGARIGTRGIRLAMAGIGSVDRIKWRCFSSCNYRSWRDASISESAFVFVKAKVKVRDSILFSIQSCCRERRNKKKC